LKKDISIAIEVLYLVKETIAIT